MNKINLLPEAKQIQKKVQKMNVLSTAIAIGMIAFVLLASIILGTLVVAKKANLSNLKKDISTTEGELKDYKTLEDAVISLEGGLKKIDDLVKGNKKWDKLFENIEKATPTDVQFVRLDITGGKVKADLVGKDVNSLSRFMESFKGYKVTDASKGDTPENLFQNVDVKGYTKEGTGVKFNAEFEINQNVLWQ